MKALIVDDELHCRENLSILLKRKCECIDEIQLAESVNKAIDVLKRYEPNIVFLDIRMPDKDGFQLLRYIDNSKVCIVFVTAHDEYALRSIKCGPTAYLLKPIDTQELVEAVDQVKRQLEVKQNSILEYNMALSHLTENLAQHRTPEKLCLSHSKTLQIVNLSDIVCLSSDSYYTTFYLFDGQKIVMSKTLKFYQDILGDQFIRIHRSHLINIDHIKTFKYETGMINMTGDIRLNVSRRKVNEVVQRLKQIS